MSYDCGKLTYFCISLHALALNLMPHELCHTSHQSTGISYSNQITFLKP